MSALGSTTEVLKTATDETRQRGEWPDFSLHFCEVGLFAFNFCRRLISQKAEQSLSVPTATTDSTTIISSSQRKEWGGSHWLKRWRRRYCRLHFARQELAFCRSEDCPAHITLCLQGLRSVCALGAKEVGKANILQLITAQGVSFFLYTATAGERDAWVAAVELCMYTSAPIDVI